MRVAVVVLGALATVLVGAPGATAQEPPPPIGPFVVDIRGTFARFTSEPQLAQSRGLSELELPGGGFGLDTDAQFYFFTWKAITFGAGGQITFARSHSAEFSVGGAVERAVTERFTSIAPQISLNFGTGNGWSYLSGGIGASTWFIVPDGYDPLPADQERLKTINYGGGARWFAKRHLAFHFDVRFYAIDPGTPAFGLPGSPRTTFMIAGAGVSLK